MSCSLLSMKSLWCLILLGLFVSCGNPTDLLPNPEGNQTIYKTEPAQAEAYSYELRTLSCSTGKHSFETFEAVCGALKDHELNKECALEKREDLFINSQCPGNFS